MPGDPPGTWTLAKMWFNHADAAIHQSLTHLGISIMVCYENSKEKDLIPKLLYFL